MYELGGRKIRSIFGIPSGIDAVNPSVIERLAQTTDQLGFITGKSISAKPVVGHTPPVYARFGPYSGINAIGLDNPGSEVFAQRLSKITLPNDFFLMLSIFGGEDPAEWIAAATPLLPYAHGFEANLSCPHSKNFGLKVGQKLDLVIAILEALVELCKPQSIPVFAKLSPAMDIEHVVNGTKGLGIAGYTIGNSFGPNEFRILGHPVLTNKVGGVSGRAITGLTLDCIRKARKNTTLTIIGGGGISTGQDVRNAINAGANFVAIGTARQGMSTDQTPLYFKGLAKDVRDGTHDVEILLDFIERQLDKTMFPQEFEVAENTALAEDLFLLEFTHALTYGSGRGQFVFAWIPDQGERPFSILEMDPLKLLFRVRGKCTCIMSQMQPGQSLYIRGPHGNPPQVKGKLLLVGGGTGAASLYLCARHHDGDRVALLGASDQAHLYAAAFRPYCKSVYCVTESGDTPLRGFVTEHLNEVLRREKPDSVLMCGPVGMLKAGFDIIGNSLPEDQVLGSIESYMGCGVKICGKCATDAGFSPCVDGTFMTRMQLGLCKPSKLENLK